MLMMVSKKESPTPVVAFSGGSSREKTLGGFLGGPIPVILWGETIRINGLINWFH